MKFLKINVSQRVDVSHSNTGILNSALFSGNKASTLIPLLSTLPSFFILLVYNFSLPDEVRRCIRNFVPFFRLEIYTVL